MPDDHIALRESCGNGLSKKRKRVLIVPLEHKDFALKSPEAPMPFGMRIGELFSCAVNGHGRMDYETDALVAVAKDLPITAITVPDLCWGEIDDERHYARIVNEVLPGLRRL